MADTVGKTSFLGAREQACRCRNLVQDVQLKTMRKADPSLVELFVADLAGRLCPGACAER